jgi:hypothetical protein
MKLVLIIVIVLTVHFFMNKSRFTEIKSNVNPDSSRVDVYHLDTRFEYPTVPPVNPMAYKTLTVTSVPVDHGLFSTQENSQSYILDQNNRLPPNTTNQLDYSGGTTQLLKIPLQMNEPYNEQLRTQEVLITPYNRIKYQVG